MTGPEESERDMPYVDGQAHFSWFGAHKPIIETMERTPSGSTDSARPGERS